MKQPRSSPESPRFEGNLRHYHRAGAPPQRTWDDWVNGSEVKATPTRNVWKILGIAVGLLGLCGIIIGLAVELG